MGTKYASRSIDNAIRQMLDEELEEPDMDRLQLKLEARICDIVDEAYTEGKEEGRSDGYKEGYEEGHSDGYSEAKDE